MFISLMDVDSFALFWVVVIIFTGVVAKKVVLPLSHILFTYVIAKQLRCKRSLLRGAGEWAIITGGSDGIGKGFAMELAKEGLNILLLSNDVHGLEKTRKEIEDRFHVKTATFVIDFTEVNRYDRIRTVIDELPSVACLVNNVGMFRFSKDCVTGADDIDWKEIVDQIQCNCIPVACMTRIVLRKMLKQRSPGRAIINMSSVVADHCSPFMSVYCATKAFVLQYSNCLAADLAGTGILVQAFQPSLVSTSLSKAAPSWRVPLADAYAKSALDMLGVEENSKGYLMHAIYTFVQDLLPSQPVWRMKLQVINQSIAKHGRKDSTSDIFDKKNS